MTVKPTPLHTECAWCGEVLQEGREPVSHGICEECWVRVMGEGPPPATEEEIHEPR